MKSSPPKVVVVLGPTATGKSDLAVEIAKQFGGEVISADSRQVYRGLDIGSGKITKTEMRGVPHHLLDVANPKTTFTVAQFKKLAEKTIADILKRGKIPIICGGTGFYIQAVVDNITLPEVKPNKALRKELARKSARELFSLLKKLDRARAETIDPHNPHRLIRAIEIATALGKVPQQKSTPRYDALLIGLDVSDQKLKDRIHVRLIKRMRQGMVAEAKHLHSAGLLFKRMEELGLEYRYLGRLLQNKASKEEMLKQLETEIWHYAKRQRTWFKRDKRIHWIDPLKKTDRKKAVGLVKQFLKA